MGVLGGPQPDLRLGYSCDDDSSTHQHSKTVASPSLTSVDGRDPPTAVPDDGSQAFSATDRPQSPWTLPEQSSTKAPDGPLNNENLVERTAIHRLNARGSVQALVVDDEVIFAGLQGGEIVAWSLDTYELLARVSAHQQSVLGLSLSDDKTLLFSCGVDSVVHIWSTSSLKHLYALHSHYEVGDIFCLSFSARKNTIFWGAQNSSIQWYELENTEELIPRSKVLPGTRKHRFFDSLGPGGVSSSPSFTKDVNHSNQPDNSYVTVVSESNYLPYAHKSYIYSMLLAKGLFDHDNEQEILITAGGGGTIKLWSVDHLHKGVPILLEKFKNKVGNIYSLAYKAPFLFAGLENGIAHIYNLASRQLVHRLQMGCGDILQIQVLNGRTWCGTSKGLVKHTSKNFSEVDHWIANHGKILATALTITNNRSVFITAGSDSTIAFWDISENDALKERSQIRSNDDLVNSLRKFVSFRSVSNNQKCVSDCHQAATFLRKLFNTFGATTSFISAPSGINPILVAKFPASTQTTSTRTIMFYGHYDVVDAEFDKADGAGKWNTDPFKLFPTNGYFYGRGVTDNKGPILAALYAVADLAQTDSLTCNVTFLIEGDEEAGSRGLRYAVSTHKQEIGNVDFILLSNSYWLDDHIPCLTFGMRGVVHANVEVYNSRSDLHSGMDGRSQQHEPLKDLMVLLGSLIGSDGTKIQIPHFYDAVDELRPEELEEYSKITSTLMLGHPEIKDKQAFTDSLLQKWCEPNLTIHQIQTPEAKNAVTIANSAKASLSIRIVPGQSADEIGGQLIRFLDEQWQKLDSGNSSRLQVTSKADPWLGEIHNELYSSLREAVKEVWNPNDASMRDFPAIEMGTSAAAHKRPSKRRGSSLITAGTFTLSNTPREPLLIREGGSIAAISLLEQEFKAPAAMFPMGQASDNAHLDNERIRVDNLYKGRAVLRRVFSKL